MNIGGIILELRREKGYTQEKLAQMLGVSAAAVSKWETDSAYPDIVLLPQLAEVFDVSLDRLFGSSASVVLPEPLLPSRAMFLISLV